MEHADYHPAPRHQATARTDLPAQRMRLTHRNKLKIARRQRMKEELVRYIGLNPGVVPPEVAEAFLRHGKKLTDLYVMMDAKNQYTRVELIPEHIKRQGRALFRNYLNAVLERRRLRKAKATRASQKSARKINRRAIA